MPSVFEYANEWTQEQLKTKYNELRKLFNDRIYRLAKVDKSKKIAEYRSGYKRPKSVSEIEKLPSRKNWTEKARQTDWATRVAELENLVNKRSLSLSGRKQIRQDSINKLQEQGFESIDNNNYDRFVSFMNWCKAMGVLNDYDSNQVAEAFDQWASGGIIDDDSLAYYINQWESDTESVDLFD